MRIPSFPPLRSALLVTALALPMAGCGEHTVVVDAVRLRSTGREAYPVIVMSEPMFTMEHQPSDVFIRSHQLVDALGVEYHVPVVAPWELELADGETWPHGERFLQFLIASNGLNPDDVWALDFEIERNGSDRAVITPEGFGGGVQTLSLSEMTVRLRLRSSTGNQTYATVEVEFEDDPFVAEADEYEQHPMVAEAIQLAAERLAEELREGIPGGPIGVSSGIRGTHNVNSLFAFGAGAGQPIAVSLEGMEPEVEFATRYAWRMRVERDVSVDEARYFDTMAAGVLVEAVGGVAANSDLRVGDYILEVEGRSADGIHVVERQFLTTPPGDSVGLLVQRGGETRHVEVDIE